MKEFVIADLHLGHRNILEYEPRPCYSVEEMDEFLIHNWNETISDEDIVWVLGDFALCGSDRIIELVGRLNGRKRLIKGNHDKKTPTFWKKAGFENYYDSPIHRLIRQQWVVLSHEPVPIEPEWINVHGHTHSQPTGLNPNTHRCVSVELINYRPILLDIVLRRNYNAI